MDFDRALKPWLSRHLLGIESLSRDEIVCLLQLAAEVSELPAHDLRMLPSKAPIRVLNLFFEPSTRTSMSFEVAARNLGMEVINFAAESSSLKKGESFEDTVRVINAIAEPDVVVVRHGGMGAANKLSELLDVSVINAGDGVGEHPTQALLDSFTILRAFGRKPSDGLEGMKVAIVGDIKHSRVARSNIHCLQKLGGCVALSGPADWMPKLPEGSKVQVHENVEQAIQDADVVMALRIQKERIEGALSISSGEYFERFGMSLERFKRLKPNAIFMHPGPMNRGVEVACEVADHNRSVVLEQVKNGVFVRMAALLALSFKGER